MARRENLSLSVIFGPLVANVGRFAVVSGTRRYPFSWVRGKPQEAHTGSRK
jgi:hypothetical protein